MSVDICAECKETFYTQDTYHDHMKVHAYKPYTIDELVTAIYEDNLSHFEYMDNMNGGDCDCAIHTALTIIVKYWGE